jgi:hypothetical protein
MLRGGRHPAAVAWGWALGLPAGLVAGANATVVALVLLATLLNVSTRAFVAACLTGGGLAWLAGDLRSLLGSFVLDDLGLASAVAIFGDGVVPALGWDSYRIIGGAVLGIVLAVPAARAGYMIAAARAARTSAALDVAAPRRILRRGWWLATPALLALALVGVRRFGTQVVSDTLLRELAAATDATVTAGNINLSLWTGELEIDDLRLVRATAAGEEQVCLGSVRGRLEPGALLRGRIDCKRLRIEGVASHQSSSAVAPSLPEPVRIGPDVAEADQLIELNAFLIDPAAVPQRLEALRRVLAACQWVAELDAPIVGHTLAGDATASDRSELGHPPPRIDVGQIDVEGFTDDWDLGPKAKLVINGLHSHGPATDASARCRVVLPEYSAEIVVELAGVDQQPRHRVQFRAFDVPLAKIVGDRYCGPSNVLRSGVVSMLGEGTLASDNIDVGMQLEFRELVARLGGNDRVAGLGSDVWNAALMRLGGLDVDAALVGRWSLPQVQVPLRKMVAQLRHQLRSAGDHELAEHVDREINRPAEAPAPQRDAIAAEPAEPPAADEVPSSSEPANPGPGPSLADPQGEKVVDSTGAEPEPVAPPTIAEEPPSIAEAEPSSLPVSQPPVPRKPQPVIAASQVLVERLPPIMPDEAITAPPMDLPPGPIVSPRSTVIMSPENVAIARPWAAGPPRQAMPATTTWSRSTVEEIDEPRRMVSPVVTSPPKRGLRGFLDTMTTRRKTTDDSYVVESSPQPVTPAKAFGLGAFRWPWKRTAPGN